MGDDDRKWISLEETLRLIARMGAARDDIVLVGGQAVAAWAARYRASDAALAALHPLSSKDVDFYGGPAAVRAVAADLKGVAWVIPPFDTRPMTGTVTVMVDGRERVIDFLKMLLGIDNDELRSMAVDIPLTAEGQAFRLRVMHPIHCLRSRLTNVAEVRKYQGDRGLRQARAAVRCMRGFTNEVLDAGKVRAALKLNERVFKLAFGNDAARTVARDFGIEAFDAVVADHPALPDEFRDRRYPKMREQIASRRG